MIENLCVHDRSRGTTDRAIKDVVEGKLNLRESQIPILGLITSHTSQHVAKRIVNHFSLAIEVRVISTTELQSGVKM